MSVVYLSIFTKILNWVLEKIFEPIFKWLANLLSDFFSWIFDSVLAPLLKNILWPFVQWVFDLLMELIGDLVYMVFSDILVLIDTCNDVFDKLIGLKNVSVLSDGIRKDMPLLDAVFELKTLSNAYWLINFTSLTLLVLFTVIAVGRSTFDFDFENKIPVSHVIRELIKAVLQLFTLQIFVLCVLRLASAILQVISNVFNDITGGAYTLGSMIFCVTSFNAAKNTAYNLNGGGDTSKIGFEDAVRKPFYLNQSGHSYRSLDQVKNSFNTAKFDYFLGIIIAFALTCMLVACLLVFVCRLFDLLLLYVASPFFVSIMPLDDGKRFKQWRELFLGKAFGGFGMVMGMKIYMLVCPAIMGNGITFDTSTEINYLTKILFLVGGAWAVLKSGSTVTTIISAQAGSAEGQTAAVGYGAVWAAGMFAVKSAFAAATGGSGAAAGAGKGAKNAKNAKNAKKGGDAFKGEKSGSSSDSDSGENKFNGGNSQISMKRPGSASPQISMKRPGSTGTAPQISMNRTGGSTTAAASSSSARTSGSQKSDAAKEGSTGYFKEGEQYKLDKNYVLGFKSYKDKDGKSHTGFSLGIPKLLNVKRDGKGTKLSIAGFNFRWGNDGKLDKVGFSGIVKFRRGDKDHQGMHMSKLNILGNKWKANTKDGKMYYSDCQLIGLHRELQEDGTAKLTDLGIVGLHRRKQLDGQYHTTRFAGIYKRDFGLDDQGNLETTHLNAFGINWVNKVDE